MDIKNGLDFKTYKLSKYDVLGNNVNNYSENGILIKCLPKILFKGNTILVSFLQLIDVRLVMMFKQIDKLKQFKYITWY